MKNEHESPIKTIIFDFDGVLSDSLQRGYLGFSAIFKHCKLEVPSYLDYITNFCAPHLQYFLDRGVRLGEAKILDIYHSRSEHLKAKLFSDVVPAVLALKDYGFTLGIISANYQTVIAHHLNKAGIRDLFSFAIGDVKQKSCAITRMCETCGKKPETVIYVGDTASDVKDSISANVNPVAMIRSVDHRRELTKILHGAGAKAIVFSLNDLFLYLNLPVLENGG